MLSKNKKSIFANLIQKVTSFLLGLILVTGTAFVMLNGVKVEAQGENRQLQLQDCEAYLSFLPFFTENVDPALWYSSAKNKSAGLCKTETGLGYNCKSTGAGIQFSVRNAAVSCERIVPNGESCITLSDRWLANYLGGERNVQIKSDEKCLKIASEMCDFFWDDTSKSSEACKKAFQDKRPVGARSSSTDTTIPSGACTVLTAAEIEEIKKDKPDLITTGTFCKTYNDSVYACSKKDSSGNYSVCLPVNKEAKANALTVPSGNSTGNCAGLTEIVCVVLDIVIKIITFLLWGIVQLFKFVLGVMGGMFVILVSINPASNELLNIAYAPWQTVLNIANIVLLAGIIFMGFGYILNLDIIKKAKGLQDFFLGLLVVGVMMQLTFTASAAVVNFTNGLGNIIYFGAGGIAGDSITNNPNISANLRDCLTTAKASNGDGGVAFVNTFICNVSQISKATSQAEAGNIYNAITEVLQDESSSGFVTMALVLMIYGLAIFSFVRILFILLVRIFGVWMLVVVSPLALVAYFSPLPMIKDFATKWIDNFLKLSFAYPFFTFGITLVTLIIGNVSSAIRQSAAASGIQPTAAISGGVIDTFAQGAQDLGSGTGTLAANIIPTAGLADPDVIASIIIGLFCFGLVFAFGELFWKVFSGFWDAAVKAGKAIASTVSTGAKIGAGAVRTGGQGLAFATKGLDKGINFLKSKDTKRLAELENSKKGFMDQKTDLESRKQKLEDEKKAKFKNMMDTNMDATKTQKEKDDAKRDYQLTKSRNNDKIKIIDNDINNTRKKMSNLDVMMVDPKRKINFYDRQLGGVARIKDTITRASNAPEFYLSGGGLPGLIGEKLNPKNWEKDQKARMAGNRMDRRLETEEKLRRDGYDWFLKGTSYNELEGYFNGKDLTVSEDELKNRKQTLIDQEIIKESRVRAAKLGASANAKRLQAFMDKAKGDFNNLDTSDREAFLEGLKTASNETDGLSSLLSESFVKNMQDLWEKLDTETQGNFKKEYGGLFMKDSARAAWVAGADPKEIRNLNSNALLFKGGSGKTLWEDMYQDRYGGDFAKATAELGEGTLGRAGISGPMQIKPLFTNNATDTLKNSSSYKAQSEEVKNATQAALQRTYSKLNFSANPDSMVAIEDNIDNPKRQEDLINGQLTNLKHSLLGEKLSGVTSVTSTQEIQDIISNMTLDDIRMSVVGSEAYEALASNASLSADQRLQAAQNILLSNTIATIGSEGAIKQSYEAQAMQINEAVKNSRPTIDLAKQKQDALQYMSDEIAKAGLMQATQESLLRDFQTGDLSKVASDYGGLKTESLKRKFADVGKAKIADDLKRQAAKGTITVGANTHTISRTDVVDTADINRHISSIAAAKDDTERKASVTNAKREIAAKKAKLSGRRDSVSLESMSALDSYSSMLTDVGNQFSVGNALHAEAVKKGAAEIATLSRQEGVATPVQALSKGIEAARIQGKNSKDEAIKGAQKITGSDLGVKAANLAFDRPVAPLS